MKKIPFLLGLFCFISVFSQNEFKYRENHFPIKYVLKNSSDTIKTRVQNVGIFSNKKFSAATYINNIYVLDSLGHKTAVPESNIHYMEITDLKNETRKFISSSSFLTKDIGLLEIKYEGKITWYRDWYYGGANITKFDFIIDFINKKVIKETGFFTPSLKDELKEKFAAYPDLLLLINSWKKDEDLMKILKIYDEK
ncbi:hypothetical protein M2347_004124 [Chryseobacterium sp. H1D6B]|uniref:hypothetical protein n=1 Tax=Chryseobacterium sp. H1D6B TaxID=2940588 RepID=UPI0015CCAACD|nr:hypothetical protein [Chryseobacterium sp. H1D6B]MDH6254397.1 hypothetical protein [Chryseobacterium sp. H1D6B]